jgi:hypothetical protein
MLPAFVIAVRMIVIVRMGVIVSAAHLVAFRMVACGRYIKP